MTSTEKKTLFLDNIKLIHNFAHKNYKKYFMFFDTYDDMFQSLSLKLWSKIDNFDATRTAYSTYATMVMVSYCKNVAKRQYKKTVFRIRAIDNAKIEDDEILDNQTDETTVTTLEDRCFLREIIRNMSSILKRKAKGYTIEEIAKENKASWSKVQRYITSEKQKMLEEMSK